MDSTSNFNEFWGRLIIRDSDHLMDEIILRNWGMMEDRWTLK
jgi:hypothetical protein